MLDIGFIRENSELVAASAKQKGYQTDIKKLLSVDENRRLLLTEIEQLRAERNELSGKYKSGSRDAAAIEQAKKLKASLTQLQTQLNAVDDEYEKLMRTVPNVIPDDTPQGGEEANREIKKWGETAERSYEVKDHLSWSEARGLIDFARGTKVAGNKFYYLKSSLVDLELALVQFGLSLAKEKGFWPMTVPHMVNTKILEGAGFSAKGEERQIYKIEDHDLNLIATAEIPLTGFFAGEIIPSDWLPAPMAGWSPAYRQEAGAYGKHSQGLYRVHQFSKVELYVYCKPADSEEWHQKLLAIEEEVCQRLNLPYRVVRIAAGDLGAPAYKKYDIEYWAPVDKTYRELMSCSNVTDYQARRLNIRYKKDDGQTEFVHTLNATAAATSRLIIAIIENCQQADGSVKVPEPLQPFMGGQNSL